MCLPLPKEVMFSLHQLGCFKLNYAETTGWLSTKLGGRKGNGPRKNNFGADRHRGAQEALVKGKIWPELRSLLSL